MMQHHSFQNNGGMPPASIYGTFDVEEMISVAGRLSELLAAENNILRAMRLKDLPALQEEKRALTQQVEAFQRMVAADRAAVTKADPEKRDQLLSVTEALAGTIEQNLYLNSVAQHVNQRVMQTIVEAMTMQQRVGIYGSGGQANGEPPITLSLNLNERA